MSLSHSYPLAWLPILILRHILWGNNFLNYYLVCYSVTKACWTLCSPRTAAHPAALFFTICYSLLKVMGIELVMLSISFSAPLSPFTLSLSQYHVFSSESALGIRWPKYWSFSISPSREQSELISFRMDWFDLLEVANGIVLFLGYFNRRFPGVPCLCSKKQFQLVDNKVTLKKCRIVI